MNKLARAIPILAFLSVLSCGSSPRTGGVLLVILDTVRADHLSCYGYPKATTPNLDRVAAEGERYLNAFSQSPWTLPSVATILTGLSPNSHGAGRQGDVLFPLHDEVTTVAQRMSNAGYATGGFFSVLWCDPGSGLARGFDHYNFETSDATNQGHRTADQTTIQAMSWLESLDTDSFFLVVHYFDPHMTYDPPEPFDSVFEPDEEDRIARGFGNSVEVSDLRNGKRQLTSRQKKSLVARYDGELAFVDQQFGRLRKALEDLGRWDETLVIVVADHGEEFWDHGGFEHGHSHYREILQVPLLLRRPGGPAGVTDPGIVRQLDIAPTILDFAGVKLTDELEGSPLGSGESVASFAEGTLYRGELASIRSESGTLIFHHGLQQGEYFLPDDPGESNPLPVEGEIAGRLLDRIKAAPRFRADRTTTWTPTEEQREQLRSLGYTN